MAFTQTAITQERHKTKNGMKQQFEQLRKQLDKWKK